MNKSQITKIKRETVLSEIQYYTVVDVVSDIVKVRNERGFEFHIQNKIVEEGSFSADQFDKQEKITKTEMGELFSSIGDTVFTVNFNKQVKKEDVKAALDTLYANKGGAIISKSDFDKKVKSILSNVYEGEERTLVGYRISSDVVLGRSTVIDLNIVADPSKTYDVRLRQVDHRSINWLIYKNVKYIVK